jgi:multidrug efflux pump
LGTLLTIFVVPTMYTLLARKHAPGAKKEATLDPDAAHHPAPHASVVSPKPEVALAK